MVKKLVFGAFVSVLMAACAEAPVGPWQLDKAHSLVSFVSTKAVNVSEVHTFTQLRGAVSEAGVADVQIELASVDTLIPIRDERMRELLFETGAFPTASLSAEVDLPGYLALAPGESLQTRQEVVLKLHGESVQMGVDLLVTRVSSDGFVVASLKPVVVNAAAFGLDAGVERLREVAGLSSIGGSVPVSFVLSFARSYQA